MYTEEEMITKWKESKNPYPSTITVIAADGFTMLHESTHKIATKVYTKSTKEVHIYDEDRGLIKKLTNAIRENQDCTVRLVKPNKGGETQTTYTNCSLRLAHNNIHCLRGHLSHFHIVMESNEHA